MKKAAQNAILAISSIILSYIVLEVAWRIYFFYDLRAKIISQLSEIPSRGRDGIGLVQFD